MSNGEVRAPPQSKNAAAHLGRVPERLDAVERVADALRVQHAAARRDLRRECGPGGRENTPRRARFCTAPETVELPEDCCVADCKGEIERKKCIVKE